MAIDNGRVGAWSHVGRGGLSVAAPVGLAQGDMSVAAWVTPAERPSTVIGDIASWYDGATRRGWILGFEHGSPCGSHGNDRTPWFGVDAGLEPVVTAHGKPGGPATVMVCSLATFDGALYAATWELGPSALGHVYRLDGTDWVSCGVPWPCNAVTRLAVHNGSLYAGVSRLKGGGSGLDDSANQEPGGRILRYEGGERWTDLGALPGADSVTALVPFRGELYAAPMYSQGLFRFDGPGSWTSCGSPGRRILALGAYDGGLYGAGNDHADVESAIALTKAGVVVPARESVGGGGVFRWEGGEAWTSRGLQPDTTQLYSIETYGGEMYIGTWPTGLVFRAQGVTGDGDARWISTGRLGDDTEVMNLQAYNGKLYAGSLPGAKVYRYDGDEAWATVATLDTTPDVLYRRAASMVLHKGELWVGTLPSATVHSIRAGAVASLAGSLAAGRHHIAGVRHAGVVTLYVDGQAVAASPQGWDQGGAIAPSSEVPLVIGGGPRAAFEGELADVGLWNRALAPDELAGLAAAGAGAGA